VPSRHALAPRYRPAFGRSTYVKRGDPAGPGFPGLRFAPAANAAARFLPIPVAGLPDNKQRVADATPTFFSRRGTPPTAASITGFRFRNGVGQGGEKRPPRPPGAVSFSPGDGPRTPAELPPFGFMARRKAELSTSHKDREDHG
jgi:hypothetical protein